MTAGQQFPIVQSPWKFNRHGQSGTRFSELLPQIGSVADDLCVIKSMHTEAINHDPAITFSNLGISNRVDQVWELGLAMV